MSSSVTMLIATPLRPKRPPRPILGNKLEYEEDGEDRGAAVQGGLGVGGWAAWQVSLPVDVVFPVGGKVIVDD